MIRIEIFKIKKKLLSFTPITTLMTLFVISGFTGCGGGGSQYSTDDITPPKSNILKLYKTGDKYENVIVDCVSQSTIFRGCSLSKLPLLEMSSKDITKDDILNRVVVSDKWMGDNFAKMLDNIPDDIKKLLGAVTAVVISKDIIPSYYDSSTGAIYLDPRYLWLTPEEAKTILKSSDYRDDYGQSLDFLEGWRYVKDNKVATKYYSIENPEPRSIDDIKYSFVRVFYHELAHANDFVADSSKLNKSKSIGDALKENSKNYLSNGLSDKYPLDDKDLKDLAGVLYRGEKPSDYLKSLTISDVGQKFEKQGANDLYNFNNQFEDFAMLFEETMMKYHFDIDRDVAFLDKNDSYKIGWGMRTKIATDEVKDRAKYVASSLLPDETDWDNFFKNGVGEATKLDNVGWFESVDSSEIPMRFKTFDTTQQLYIDFRSPEY